MTQQTNLEAMHAMAHRERDRANELLRRVKELEAAQRDGYKAMLTWVLERCAVITSMSEDNWAAFGEVVEAADAVEIRTIADIRKHMEATPWPFPTATLSSA